MRRLAGLLLMLSIISCSGCGDSHESLVSDRLSTMKEAIAILDGVRDEASAEAAKPKIKALMDKLNDLNTRQSNLTPAGEADSKAIEAKFGSEKEQIERDFAAQWVRIAFDPKISAEFKSLDRATTTPSQ